jgi:hypothetical protein
MNQHDNAQPGHPDRKMASGKTCGWKRLLKFALYLVLIVVLSGAAFVGALVFKHHRIIDAKPGGLQTQVQPIHRHGRCSVGLRP